MSYDIASLYARLPVEIRRRDAEEGVRVRARTGQLSGLTAPEDYGPIKNLLSVMLREGQIIEADIAQLYDDLFIETCADWVVPYIGKLVGATVLEDIPDADGHRRFVASTLSLRQRKGTLAAFEYAACAATGWPVAAVEYWKRIATTTSLRRPRLVGAVTRNLRDLTALERIGSATEIMPRTYDSRSVRTQQGRWGLQNIGLHLHRLRVYEIGNTLTVGVDLSSVTDPGFSVRPAGGVPQQFRFNPIGCDVPLFHRPPEREPRPGEMRPVSHFPTPILRHAFAEDVPFYFGPGRAMNIVLKIAGNLVQVDPASVESANLGETPDHRGAETWALAPHATITYLDPETGRFILAKKHNAATRVYASHHAARAFDIGARPREAGEIPAGLVTPTKVMMGDQDRERVTSIPTSADPLEIRFARSTSYRFDGQRRALVTNNIEDVRFIANAGTAPTCFVSNRNRGLTLEFAPMSKALISGLRFAFDENAKAITLRGSNASFLGSDMTITPGAVLKPNGESTSPQSFRLRIGAGMSVILKRSVLMAIELEDDVELTLIDCILDATSPDLPAIIALPGTSGHRISIIRSTVIGQVSADRVAGPDHYEEQAQKTLSGFPLRALMAPEDEIGIDDEIRETSRGIRDSIIYATSVDGEAPVKIKYIQSGCVAQSYIPPGSRVPRRFACAPANIPPRFSSQRYIHPDYLQLLRQNSPEILQGGSGGSEMGVGHRDAVPARLRNLDTIIDEHLRFGFEAGPIFEN